MNGYYGEKTGRVTGSSRGSGRRIAEKPAGAGYGGEQLSPC